MQQDSNSQPSDPQMGMLTTTLQRLADNLAQKFEIKIEMWKDL